MESLATALVYLGLGLYSPGSLHVALYILPRIIIGVPLGRLLISRIEPELFRRVCMAIDAWLISFGLSRILLSEGPTVARFAYVPPRHRRRARRADPGALPQVAASTSPLLRCLQIGLQLPSTRMGCTAGAPPDAGLPFSPGRRK